MKTTTSLMWAQRTGAIEVLDVIVAHLVQLASGLDGGSYKTNI